MTLPDMLRNAADFPNETWEDEMYLRHLELTEDAEYFDDDIQMELRNDRHKSNMRSLLKQIIDVKEARQPGCRRVR